MWCGDWFWNPIGPLGFNDVAHLVNVPSQGDPSIPYSDRLWVIIKNQFGDSFLQYNEKPNFVAENGKLYVFDCEAKTLTVQTPELPVTPAPVVQPMQLVTFSLRVANMPADVNSWSLATLTPFGEKLLYKSGQQAAGDIVSITDTPAVNCLLSQKYSAQGTTSSQYFDWFTGKNGANYVYDFSTTRITEHISNPVITTTLLPNGTTGVAYSQPLTASGGTGSYTWSISSGDFPAWANLDESAGVITGTPTAAGSSSFTAQVTDEAGATATKDLSVKINAPAPEITVISPNGGEEWVVGSSQNITWTSTCPGGNIKIQLSLNGGKSWKTIISSTPDDGSQAWTVTGLATDRARIRVASISTTKVFDISDANFNIVQSITVISPNGGEEWVVGSSQNITWTSVGVLGNVRIQLSRNNGKSWKTIISSTDNDGSQVWTVKGPATDQARIKVVSVRTRAVVDLGDANFSITP